MADPIRIEIDDGEVRAVLGRLIAACEDPAPAFALIGEYLEESTKQRFASESAPDGTPWPANTQATLDAYLARITGVFDAKGHRVADRKGALLTTQLGKSGRGTGRISKETAEKMAAKKILQGQTGMLAHEIYYNPLPDGVEIGSVMKYAAMQQFGGTRAQWPHLWGDIPPRPFLGLSDEDKTQVLDIVAGFLGEAMR